MKSRKKNTEKKKKKIKRMIRNIILFLIFSIIICFLIGFFRESKIKEGGDKKLEVKDDVISEESKKNKIKGEVEVPTENKGYQVIAKLEIPSVKIESLILRDNSEEAMKVSPVKFWGSEPNEIGNFCIAGHNYKKNNMFYNLFYLKKGEKIYLSDNKNGKYSYTISDIYKVNPENTSSIEQNTNGKRVVTLITCANYSKKRLIVQAIEDDEYQIEGKTNEYKK